MLGPTRLYYSIRAHDDTGLLVASAASAVLFAGTPFVLSEVAADYGVTLGRAGLVSTMQVGGFALSAFVAGRRFRTHRTFFIWSSLAAALLGGLSTLAPTFELFLACRFGVGIAVGLLTWLAWARAMQSASSMRMVAAIGPFTAALASPALSWLSEWTGADAVYLLIAAAFVPALFLPAKFSGYQPDRRKKSPSRSNIVLIVSLGLLSMTGSSLFVYAAVIGENVVGLDPVIVSLAFSANALAGFVAARRAADASPPRVWLYAIAPAAAAVAFGANGWLFCIGITVWGFFWWMAVPKILRSIAAWSLAPEERVGDAQSAMALGRTLGPALAGLLVGAGTTFTWLGLMTVAGTVVTAATVHGVALYRRSHLPPVPELVAR